MPNRPSVVVIGGGTGTFTVLNSLREQPVSLTALMTMVDDGGSNRVLRDEFGLLPTSGIRQAMVALSNHQQLLRDLFMYRFHQGTGISGMTFGNLFLAAVSDMLNSQEKAFEVTSKFLMVKGKILPISLDKVHLHAAYADGSEVLGQHLIDTPKHDGKIRINKLNTVPKAKISEKSRKELLTADYIILGPGDFYGNTIANLVIEGVVEAINKSKAKLIFITNLMTKYGETYGYKLSDYFTDLSKYLPLSRLDYVLINNCQDYPPEALKKYRSEFSRPVIDDLQPHVLPESVKLIRTHLVSSEIIPAQSGDTIKRSMIRHDIKKLGKTLRRIIFAQ